MTLTTLELAHSTLQYKNKAGPSFPCLLFSRSSTLFLGHAALVSLEVEVQVVVQ